MDATVLAAIIGAFATVMAAVLGQKGILDRFFPGHKTTKLLGKWAATWTDIDDTSKHEFRENLVITKQAGSKVFGYITMDDIPDKRWEFEGNFTGRFLQLYYYPSKEAEDKLFLDYGSYFFDMLGDGSFAGFSVGYYWKDGKVSVSNHQMKRVG